jgi:hypothetical protein
LHLPGLLAKLVALVSSPEAKRSIMLIINSVDSKRRLCYVHLANIEWRVWLGAPA